MLISQSTVVGLLAMTATIAASTLCLDHISHDTIAFFSGAALTFGSNYTDAADCGIKCSSISTCQTWLFTSGGQCELFRHSPVATAANPNFSYGVCRQGNSSSHEVWPSPVSSSSHPMHSPRMASRTSYMVSQLVAVVAPQGFLLMRASHCCTICYISLLKLTESFQLFQNSSSPVIRRHLDAHRHGSHHNHRGN